jgi:hypothetical protein
MRDLTASLLPVASSSEQLIIGGLGVADVCDYSQAHGLFIKSLCCGGATHPLTIPEAGVLCDCVLSTSRAIRKQFAHASRKARNVLSVEFGASLGLAPATAQTRLTIG